MSHDHHGAHEQHTGESHDHHDHSHHVQIYGRLFWVMLGLGVPTVAFSPVFAQLLGYEITGWGLWVAPALGTVMYVWGGKPFLEGGRDEIRDRRPGMMLLISLGITVAFLASWAATVGLVGPELEFWWELALLVVIMLLGHWVEMRSLAQAGSALDSLASLLPDQAERVVGDRVETVAPGDLGYDDAVIVRPGGSVPADGVITQGSAAMDESMITGESRTVHRSVGDRVVAGTVATDSGVRMRVTAVGDATTLAGISRLVDEAQNSSSRSQRVADRAAAWLFWYALGAAVLTALAWWLLGSPEEAVARVITVLVIACPHALGLAIPLVVSIATERAARGGVLITDRLALEGMRTVDVVLFDKTGTLTRGTPAVTGVEPADGWSADEVLRLAAAAESDSEHPLARAIVAAADERSLEVPPASGFSSSPAVGVQARVDGQLVQVGGPYLLEQEGVVELGDRTMSGGSASEGMSPVGSGPAGTSPASTTSTDAPPATGTLAQWRDEGATILHVVVDREVVVGALRLVDEVRPESAAAVAALHERGVEVQMITGDAEAVAAAVSEDLGIDRYFAGVRPEDKASTVRRLQEDGRRVAMVGDGVNDAPALAQSDVGVAVGAGTDVAIASAGIVLAADDPRAVVSVAVLSAATYRKMVQNLWWAGGYNLLAVPLAAGVLAPAGIIMPMSVGAVLMSLSTVVVAVNAQLLRRLDLSPDEVAADDTPRPTGR